MDLEKIMLDFLNFVGQLNFDSIGSILTFLLVVFWLVIVGWVWIDSGERTSKTYARVVYVLIVLLLNIPGLIIYLIVRPSETIEEIYWADLERRYLKYETADLGDCPKCGDQLFPGNVYCSNCGYELKKKCPNCEVVIDKRDKYCSFCGTKLNGRKKEEEYPSVETMQQQIAATREEATETVESNRTKYKSGKSIVVKLGDAVLSVWNSIVLRITKANTERKKSVENISKKEVVIKEEAPKNKRRKKDKGKRKKKNKK